MKNQPHLKLTMGRKTKADNLPVTKKDHKDTLAEVGRKWLVSQRKKALRVENYKRFEFQISCDAVSPFLELNRFNENTCIE